MMPPSRAALGWPAVETLASGDGRLLLLLRARRPMVMVMMDRREGVVVMRGRVRHGVRNWKSSLLDEKRTFEGLARARTRAMRITPGAIRYQGNVGESPFGLFKPNASNVDLGG